MTYIEWPKHSGRIANYSDAELAYMNVFRQQHEAGEITKEEADRQMANCHDLKVEFGIDLIKGDITASDVKELPDPGRKEIGKFSHPDSGAPETQRQSAILIYPRTGTWRLRVLNAIANHGGATDEELYAITGGDENTVRPRRNELMNDGWIEDSGRRRRTPSKKDAVVWDLTANARAQWKAFD